MHLPDYQGGSIVNLMRSIERALDARPCAAAAAYPDLNALPAQALAGARNIVLLIIDGLGHDYLTSAGAGSALHSGLRARISSVFPSTTATAISSFLTGVGPQQHALTGWHAWLRELGCLAATLRFRPRHGGEALSKAGIDPRSVYTSEPMFERLAAKSYVVSPANIIDSDYNLAHCGLAERRPYQELSGLLANVAAIVRGGSERQFIHAYTYAFDDTAHSYGSASPELHAKFREIDAAYSRFLADIAGSDTLVLTVADHGFIDSPAPACIELEDHPELAQMLMLPLCGERRAAYCYVQPGQDAAFEHYVQTRLDHCAELYRSSDLIAQGWFGLGPANPRLAERVGHYTLVMKDNFTIKDWILGESRYLTKGVHGGVSAAEMHVPLILAEA
ncbi:MAG: alkaline phosphatase family protein [Burkholderiales bacterium]|nr:alkaline phosphatase family protein [Burkholderiales bacterium]